MMGMRLDPETERKVLAMAAEAEASCDIDNGPIRTRRVPKLIKPGISVEAYRLTIRVAYECKNESNLRDWKARSRRSGAAWKAVREAVGTYLQALEPFAMAYAAGEPLRVTFTRIGGRHMDAMVNNPNSMKGVEDAIAYLLGANDGSGTTWRAIAEQRPGGDEVGVEIVVEVMR